VRQRAQQLSQIRSSGGECGIDGVSDQTFQNASLYPVIALQMIDRGLACTPTFATSLHTASQVS
jgi:hypothetical protein